MSKKTRRSFIRATATVASIATISGSAVAQTAAASEIALAVHRKVNDRRTSRGLDPLTWNRTLASDARQYSERMATEDFFSHTAPGEDSFSDHYSADCSSLGENILYRSKRTEGADAVAENIVEQWMGSSGHRDNILGDWNSEGVGIYTTSDGVVYATQAFGSCPGESLEDTPTETPDETDTPTSTDTPEDTPEDTETPDPTTTDAPEETPTDTATPTDAPPTDTPDETDTPESDDGWDDDDDGYDGGHDRDRGRDPDRDRDHGHGDDDDGYDNDDDGRDDGSDDDGWKQTDDGGWWSGSWVHVWGN